MYRTDAPAGNGGRPPSGRGHLVLIAVLTLVTVAAVAVAVVVLIRDQRSPSAAVRTPTPHASVSSKPTTEASPQPQTSSTAWAATASDPAHTSVPILMYHIVAPVPATAAYPDLYVRPADFSRQMKYLHDEGYEAVSLAQVFAAWRGGDSLPAKPVVLSFDDGYRCDYLTIAPILARYGWTGVVSVDWKVLEQDPQLKVMVGLLARMDWEIDSHSLTHPDLRTLTGSTLAEEVTGSREQLQDEYGVPVDYFCYPSGGFNASVEAAVKRAGYTAATTTVEGIASPESDPYALPRVRVNGSATLSDFAAALRPR